MLRKGPQFKTVTRHVSSYDAEQHSHYVHDDGAAGGD